MLNRLSGSRSTYKYVKVIDFCVFYDLTEFFEYLKIFYFPLSCVELNWHWNPIEKTFK